MDWHKQLRILVILFWEYRRLEWEILTLCLWTPHLFWNEMKTKTLLHCVKRALYFEWSVNIFIILQRRRKVSLVVL